jgi:SPP1 gp7 family putative phage head morphogenesis protein
VAVPRLGLAALVEQAQALADFEEAIAELARALPADAGTILDFFEVPSGDAFDVAPAQAMAYFAAKKLKPTFSYAEMLDYEHDKAFTVAKMMNTDMLAQVRASLDSALANGTPYKEWADSITPILQSGGWWGRKEVLDPLTGQPIVAQLGSPWRLETIFRTNMQSAYAAGAWQEIEAQAEIAPFLMYDAVDDFRTRPLHAKWDRTVLPVKHTWWNSHYPPNGYNCRCGVIQLSAEEVEALGLQVARQEPDDGQRKWVNPRTGDVHYIPNGLDPGFEHNAGKSLKWHLQEVAAQKEAMLAADMKAAAQKAEAQALAEAKKISDEGTAAAAAAQAEAAAAASKAALARAQAKAAEAAAQWDAQQQLDAIAKGKETAGKGAQYKIKALAEAKKTAAWPQAKATEKLAQVLEIADQLKAKAVQSQALFNYKKAVLDGKTPPPAAVKVFNGLPEPDKAAFVAKLSEDQAKIAAAKKAAEEAAAKAAAEAAAAAAPKPSAAATVLSGEAPDPATMTVIGRKTKGGTEGALYQDTATGQKWLVKFNGSEDAVKNEVLASKLYALAGTEAPELHAITIGGRPALASRIIDGIQEVPAATLARTASVTEGFAVDAWLANWDVAGLNIDNVVLVGGRAVRIDVGGSLRYRAVGGLKGRAFGDEVSEIDSLRDGTNAQARAVFGTMSPADVERSVERVLAVSDDDIRAVVMRYGPPDEATRQALAEQLVRRKAYLARRYPAAAERVRQRQAGATQAPPAPARVTAQEQRFVEESRVNGYGFLTDSDQIEDNMVVVHAFRRTDGSDATRGFMKLRPEASAKLRASITTTAGDAPTVQLGTARDAILSAVKSINFRADKGQPLDATVVGKIQAAQTAVERAVRELRAGAAKAQDGAKLLQAADALETWGFELAAVLPGAQAGARAVKLARAFDTKAFPDEIGYALKQAQAAAAGLKWRRVSGSFSFNTADFERSFAKENGGQATVAGVGLRFEAELPDGTRITYFPHDPQVAWAMQGVVKIDAQGRGAEISARVFGALDEIGVKSTRATELDRQHLYVNAYARIALLRKGDALKRFEAIAGRDDAALGDKLGLLQAATGVDVTATEGWRQIDGVRQAFGHGRAYQLRPDLDAQQLAALNRTHVVYHNPQGLGADAGARVFERLKMVIEGGGTFASLTDRVRRGVPLSGSSVSSDLASGGGDYHFTRIKARAQQTGTGVYWRTSVLRRMDAISYASDEFGRTTPGFIEQTRRGQSIEDFRLLSQGGSNETIFKGGLSIFDDVDRIVLSSAAEVKDAIAWMRSKGYSTWPDGRALEDVIMTKAKHSANP